MMITQNKVWITALTLLTICLLAGCGPSKEEQQRREQARQDSLQKVQQQLRQQQMQQRQDSLAKVRKDSLKKADANKMHVSFDEQGNYSVQVEAWRSRKKAQAQIQKWKDRGFDDAFVVQYGNKQTGNIWFRVRLGKLASRSDAQKLKETLQKRYQVPAWIARVHA